LIELTADLWDPRWDLRCITTNGTVKKNGECVMGRGVANQAKLRYKRIAKILGNAIKAEGNHVHFLGFASIASFPVKHNWWEKADPDLILRNAVELNLFVDEHSHVRQVAIPRPGCGNGGLNWEDVKPVIDFLDDRFYVITKCT